MEGPWRGRGGGLFHELCRGELGAPQGCGERRAKAVGKGEMGIYRDHAAEASQMLMLGDRSWEWMSGRGRGPVIVCVYTSMNTSQSARSVLGAEGGFVVGVGEGGRV